MTGKELGRISSARFGHGGYQDAQIGLSFSFEGESWGVQDFKGWWTQSVDSKGAQWTEEDRDRHYAEAVRLLDDTLRAAKKTDVAGLVGVPVEATFEGSTLKSWRVLTEVL